MRCAFLVVRAGSCRTIEWFALVKLETLWSGRLNRYETGPHTHICLVKGDYASATWQQIIRKQCDLVEFQPSWKNEFGSISQNGKMCLDVECSHWDLLVLFIGSQNGGRKKIRNRLLWYGSLSLSVCAARSQCVILIQQIQLCYYVCSSTQRCITFGSLCQTPLLRIGSDS